jgi:hypothetical protein
MHTITHQEVEEKGEKVTAATIKGIINQPSMNTSSTTSITPIDKSNITSAAHTSQEKSSFTLTEEAGISITPIMSPTTMDEFKTSSHGGHQHLHHHRSRSAHLSIPNDDISAGNISSAGSSQDINDLLGDTSDEEDMEEYSSILNLSQPSASTSGAAAAAAATSSSSARNVVGPSIRAPHPTLMIPSPLRLVSSISADDLNQFKQHSNMFDDGLLTNGASASASAAGVSERGGYPARAASSSPLPFQYHSAEMLYSPSPGITAPSSPTYNINADKSNKKSMKSRPHKQTHLRDIVAWKQLSYQYSLGFAPSLTDSSIIEPVAIYDKSYSKPNFDFSKGNIKETLAMGFHTREKIHQISLEKRIKHVKTIMELLNIIFDIKPSQKERSSKKESSIGHSVSSRNSNSIADAASTHSEKETRSAVETIIVPESFFTDVDNGLRFKDNFYNNSNTIQRSVSPSISSWTSYLSTGYTPNTNIDDITNRSPSPFPLSPNPSRSRISYMNIPSTPTVNVTVNTSAAAASALTNVTSPRVITPVPSPRSPMSRMNTSNIINESSSISSSIPIFLSTPNMNNNTNNPTSSSLPRCIRFTQIDWASMIATNSRLREFFLNYLTADEFNEIIHLKLMMNSNDKECCMSKGTEEMNSLEKQNYSPLFLYLHSLVFIRTRVHMTDIFGREKDKKSPFSNPVSYVYELSLNRSHPVKIIDLRYPLSSFKFATARASLTNIFKGGLGAIPFWGPPQVVVAATERIFDFSDILALQKQAEAMEMILEAIRGNKNSPFYNNEYLDKQKLMDSIFYLLRSNIMLGMIIKNSMTKNDELASKYINSLQEKRNISLSVLRNRTGENKLLLFEIPYTDFCFGIQRDNKTGILKKFKLYILCYTKIGRKEKPHAAIDFININKEKNKRQALQYLLVASNMLWLPLPGITSVAKLAYKSAEKDIYYHAQKKPYYFRP